MVQFATAGQPYGICLLPIVAAFRCAVLAVERSGPLAAGAAGLLAGAAAASSLLTAPVAPVLWVWILLSNRAGTRWRKLAWFAAGALVAWLPVFWLATQGPRQVFFNVVEDMLVHRPAGWPGAVRHDLEVLFSWIDSPQVLILVALAAAGLYRWRKEFALCFWLAAALALRRCGIV